jgi:hypothetical protein
MDDKQAMLAMRQGLRLFRYYMFIARLSWDASTPLLLVTNDHPSTRQLLRLLDARKDKPQSSDTRLRCRDVFFSLKTALAAHETYHMDFPTRHVSPSLSQLLLPDARDEALAAMQLEPESHWEDMPEDLNDAWRLAWFGEMVDSNSENMEFSFMNEHVVLWHQWDLEHTRAILGDKVRRGMPALPRLVSLGPRGGWAVTGLLLKKRRWHQARSLTAALAAWMQWVVTFHDARLETNELISPLFRSSTELMTRATLSEE